MNFSDLKIRLLVLSIGIELVEPIGIGSVEADSYGNAKICLRVILPSRRSSAL